MHKSHVARTTHLLMFARYALLCFMTVPAQLVIFSVERLFADPALCERLSAEHIEIWTLFGTDGRSQHVSYHLGILICLFAGMR